MGLSRPRPARGRWGQGSAPWARELARARRLGGVVYGHPEHVDQVLAELAGQRLTPAGPEGRPQGDWPGEVGR